MLKKALLALLMVSSLSIASDATLKPGPLLQDQPTLAGEWIVTSSPINNEVISRMGNGLGFPDRHMVFEQQGELRTGVVLREDVGVAVNPLGVWRMDGTRFSTTFQLWCPDSSQPCGSIVMRGEFTREDRIRGTMTAFFDEKDETRPTGYDTWTFSFRGERLK
jgi:hypothetical protein